LKPKSGVISHGGFSHKFENYSTTSAGSQTTPSEVSNPTKSTEAQSLTTQQKLEKILAMAHRIFLTESSSASIEFLQKQYKVFPHIRMLERQGHYLIAKANAMKMATFQREYQKHLKKVDLGALPDNAGMYLDKDAQEMVEKVKKLAEREEGTKRNEPKRLGGAAEGNKNGKLLSDGKGDASNSGKKSLLDNTSSDSSDPYERPPTIEYEKVEQHVKDEDIADQRPEQIMDEAVYILKQVVEILQSRNKLTTKRDFRLNQLLTEVLHELGDFTQALQVLKGLRERHPEDVRTFELLGYLYLREGFKTEDVALQSDSDNLVYKRNQLFLHSVQFFSYALELNPHHVRCLSGRARAFHRLKQYDLAVKDFDEVIGEVPDHYTTYQLRGDCHMHLGNWFKANSDLRVLLSNFEEWAESHRNELHLVNPETTLQHLMHKLAIITYNLGDDSSGRLVCTYVDYIVTGNRVHNEEERYITASALALRSRVHFENRLYNKCIEDCTRAINLDRRGAVEAFKYRAQALHQIGDVDGAKQDQYQYQLLLSSGGKA